jgi:DNA-binding winged helix-turn-helix (wHTH) protein/tetratricopeptide (TPR) repeat protein
MIGHKQILFDTFTLDTTNELLWRGSERIRLRPKTFALLRHLAERPGQLVTKSELLNAIWQNLHIGDEALKHCVAEIRKALDDSSETPRIVETVHRRGYRFIGKTYKQNKDDAPGRGSFKAGDRVSVSLGHRLVGRTSELAQLHHCLAKAIEGTRQLVFITGEQGIGKTSLMDSFLEIVNPERPDQPDAKNVIRPLIARGHCINAHGVGEAYMPFLEAFTGLCSTPVRKQVTNVLRRHAPLWLSQMPSLISASQLQSLKRAILGATHDRMMREMAEALEALTADLPLILMIEDVHWSDFSTLDLISYLAQRQGPARLLLIATYRPAETRADNHPLRNIVQDLLARQQCREFPLTYLNEAAVSQYLTQRFPGHRFPEETAAWIQQTTGGNPLFMINVLDHLVTRKLIVRRNRNWILNTTLKDAEQIVPPTIQQIIERQLERCAPQEQRLLQAASIEGIEFSIAALAAALGEKRDRIEAQCRGLAERHQFLQPASIRQVEGSQKTARYGFIHALYQNICYQRLPEDWRAQMHLRIANHLESAKVTPPGELSARLAMHFDRGRDYGRAIKYYHQAAENANQRYAGRDALALALRGIQLLESVSGEAERKEQEMCLQIALGTALMSAQGIGAEDVSRAFSRARELFQQLSKYRRSKKRTFLFSALFGLWNFHWVRADYAEARALAEQMLQLAEAEQDTSLLNKAHHSLGIILMDHGEFVGAFEHLRQCTGVISRCCAAITQCNLGFPDQALKNVGETLTHALETRNLENRIFAHLGAARVHVARREGPQALDRSQSALDLSIQNGLVEGWLVPMKSIRAWALAKIGQANNGLEQVRQALVVVRSIGTSNLMPLLSAMHAEICMDAGQIDEGLAAIEEALAAARETCMFHYEAEVYRLKGELLLRHSYLLRKLESRDQEYQEVAACFEEAIRIARQQHARSFELRATTSLARLLQKQNRQTEAFDRLTAIYNWFTEGYQTPDMLEAGNLLQALS